MPVHYAFMTLDQESCAKPTTKVHVVDDDGAVREALASFLSRANCKVVAHGSAEEFLAAYQPDRAEALILDISLPGMNGLDLLRELNQRGEQLPTLVLSANADIVRVVTAIQQGAIGFVEKPPAPEQLQQHVQTLLRRAPELVPVRTAYHRARRSLASLTPRELEVFALLRNGATAKQVARALNMSIRTAHIHRTNVFRKFDVESAVDLARIADRIAAHEAAGDSQS